MRDVRHVRFSRDSAEMNKQAVDGVSHIDKEGRRS
jgi:hypothetical protein